jgi:hypothetical protein
MTEWGPFCQIFDGNRNLVNSLCQCMQLQLDELLHRAAADSDNDDHDSDSGGLRDGIVGPNLSLLQAWKWKGCI